MFEKLLQLLADIIVAINANTAALKGAAVPTATTGTTAAEPEPKKETKKKEKTAETPAPTAPTVNDVRTAAQGLLDANDNKDGGLFAELNKKYGTTRISEVPEASRAEVIATINKATEAAKAAKANASAQV